MRRKEYMWAKDPEDLVSDLSRRRNSTSDRLKVEGVYNAIRNTYNGFYNKYWDENSSVGSTGEQGEYKTLSVNHMGSLLQHLMNMLTTQRISFDVQTFNQDYTARETQMLARAVLDMYFYERNYEEELRKALAMAMLMGTAYVEVMWEPKSKLFGVDEDNQLYFAGKPRIVARDVFSVIEANPYEDNEARQSWRIVRERTNRYDLVAQYPEKEEEILGLPKAEGWTFYNNGGSIDEDSHDYVWIYRGYHRECPALPNGRMILFAENSLFLEDWEKNPYCDPENESMNGGMPVFKLVPQARLGSAYGHSPAFNMVAVQEYVNLMDSTIASNQLAHGVQSIAVPRTAGIKVSDIGGGARLFEFDADENGKGVPEVLQLCKTAPEIFNKRQDMVSDLESLSGINAIMRGRIDTSLPPSGVAAALMTANGQLANSDIEYRYHRLIENCARFFIYVISRFQQVEDTVEVGSSRRIKNLRHFRGADLANVSNLKINLGNPLSKTIGGRVAMAEMMASQGLIKSPEQMAHIITTGEVENELEHNAAEVALIRFENEEMFRGNTDLNVLATDNHNEHIKEHRVVALDPQARMDKSIMEAYSAHLQKHMDIMDMQMERYPQIYTLITTGQPVMPAPSQDSGVPVEAVVSGAKSGPQAAVEASMAPADAASATSDIAGPAMGAMKAAETKLQEAFGQQPA